MRRVSTVTVLSISLLLVGCRGITLGPSIVAPEVIGHWVSEEPLPGRVGVRVLLDTGDTLEIEDSATGTQTAVAGFGRFPRSTSTLILYGHGPNGDWWISTEEARPDEPYPRGCLPLPGVHVTDGGDSVIIQAERTPSHTADFGIRLPKLAGVSSPEPPFAPEYIGPRTVCLDSLGRVTAIL
jgi:hypothetical protein